MKQKRVERRRFERFPHVVFVAFVKDELDLVSLSLKIIQEEVHRVIYQVDETSNFFPQSLEEFVQDEAEKTLAPVSGKLADTQ